MTIVLIAAGLVALVISLIGTQVMRRLAPQAGLMDVPSARKLHDQPMPRGGGVAIFAGLWITLWAGMLISRLPRVEGTALGALVRGAASSIPGTFWLFAGAAVIALMGLVDDRRSLPAWVRLLVQTAVALCLVVFGGHSITLFIPNPYVCGLITVVWIVGITNAFNLLDNMDGLSAGVGLIVSGLLLVVALQTGQLFLAALSAVMIGALGGFLFFNFPPARIFMGECGSTLIGYMLAVATVDFTFLVPGRGLFPVIVPLLILAVPIFDTLSVVLIRLRRGRSIFRADTNHFSHRLVALGMTRKTAVMTIYLVTVTIGLGAPVVYFASAAVAVIVLLQAAAVFAVIALLERAGRKAAEAQRSNGPPGRQSDT